MGDQRAWLMNASPEFLAADLYDCYDESEELRHRYVEDAVEDRLDQTEQRSGVLKVYGFKRLTLSEHDARVNADWVLETMIDNLDDEYGGGDAPTEPTPAMCAAAEAFAAVFHKEYVPWRCELVTEADVDVLSFIEEQRPDWLDGEGR